MDSIAYLPLLELRRFLTLENIENLKVKFISEYIENGWVTKLTFGPNMDYVSYFEGFIGDYSTITYESFLKTELVKFNSIKHEIDYALIQLAANKERLGYISNIESEIKYIAKTQSVMFKKYKYLREVIKDLVQYLVDKGISSLENPFENEERNENIYVPPFKLKENLRKSKFSKLYQLFCRYGVIEPLSIMEEDFIKVMMGLETDTYIRFNISNRFAFNVIDALKHIYKVFDAKTIENSGRFYSKENTPLRQSNYNSTLRKIPKNNDKEYKSVLEGIKTLFPI